MGPNRGKRLGAALLLACLLCGCGVPRPRGIIYTNLKLPLTRDLHGAPNPEDKPTSGRTLEIKEPISGLGLYVEVDSNAIGDIARQHGMQTLYWADHQYFSILGVWTTDRTILFGE